MYSFKSNCTTTGLKKSPEVGGVAYAKVAVAFPERSRGNALKIWACDWLTGLSVIRFVTLSELYPFAGFKMFFFFFFWS